MRINRSLLGWGVFFIVLGCVPLAVRSGALDAGLAARTWELWPLLLIGAGLGLLLSRTRVALVGSLTVSITLGLMAGGLLAGGIGLTPGVTACGLGTGASGGAGLAERRGPFASGTAVAVELDCGSLDLTGAQGTEWILGGETDSGQQPVVEAAGGRLGIRTPDRTGTVGDTTGSHLALTLPRSVPMDLAVSVNAGSAALDLSLLSVDTLDLAVNAGEIRAGGSDMVSLGTLDAQVNAGSLVIALPAPDATLRGALTVNAGSIEVCVPSGVGLRINVRDQALGDTNFDERGLVANGDTWTLPGWETSTQRIDLDASVNLGSITLNPEGGCG